MIKKRLSAGFLLLFVSLFFSNVLFSQTRVVKKSAIKNNNYGITYFLPKSMLDIRATVVKVETKAGAYYKYAERYLGLSDVVTEDKVYYILENIEVVSKGVPDTENSYLIEFKTGTVAPFVCLTEDGMICSINAEFEENAELWPPTLKKEEKSGNKLNPEGLFTEEYLQAGSTTRMAEVAAKQIYKIRESRMDIVTGESENAPRDGAALQLVLQQLEDQENALLSLFTGTTEKSTEYAHFELEPASELEKELVFRFSTHLGIVDADDLAGAPVYVNLEQTVGVESPGGARKENNKTKEIKGVVYNVPGKGFAEIFYGTRSMCKKELIITQFGETDFLINSTFDNKKSPVKVYFYPHTGGLKEIVQ